MSGFKPLGPLADAVKGDEPFIMRALEVIQAQGGSFLTAAVLINSVGAGLLARAAQNGIVTRRDFDELVREKAQDAGLGEGVIDTLAEQGSQLLEDALPDDAKAVQDDLSERQALADKLAHIEDLQVLPEETMDLLWRVAASGPEGREWVSGKWLPWWESDDDGSEPPEVPDAVYLELADLDDEEAAEHEEQTEQPPEDRQEGNMETSEKLRIQGIVASPAYNGDPSCTPEEIAAARETVTAYYEREYQDTAPDERGRAQVVTGDEEGA